MKLNQELIEKNVGWMIVLIVLVDQRRRPGRDRAAVLPEVDHRAGGGLKPYTPLQLTGRDVYMREGCYNCHSQMIRPFRAETERYGHYSVAGEFVYDHPFQWGSKRTGPDLRARRRPLLRRLAPRAPQQPARRGARVEHAGLPVAREDAGGRRRTSRPRCARCGASACPYTDEEIAKARRGARGQDRAGRAGRVPAEPGPRHEEREVGDGTSDQLSCGSATTVLAFAGLHRHRRRGPTAAAGASAFEEAANAPFALPDDDDGARTDRSAIARSGGHERFHLGFLELVRHRPHAARRSRLRLAAAGDGKAKAPAGARHRPRRRPAARRSRPPATSGTATSPSSTTRCRAGGCGCSGSRSCSRSATWSLYPGLGNVPGVLGWTSTGAYAKERRRRRTRKVKPLYDKYLAMDLKQVAADPQARGDGRAAVPQQLRAVPRLRRRRQPRASPTCATATGSTAASRRRSRSRSPTAAWA